MGINVTIHPNIIRERLCVSHYSMCIAHASFHSHLLCFVLFNDVHAFPAGDFNTGMSLFFVCFFLSLEAFWCCLVPSRSLIVSSFILSVPAINALVFSDPFAVINLPSLQMLQNIRPFSYTSQGLPTFHSCLKALMTIFFLDLDCPRSSTLALTLLVGILLLTVSAVSLSLLSPLCLFLLHFHRQVIPPGR